MLLSADPATASHAEPLELYPRELQRWSKEGPHESHPVPGWTGCPSRREASDHYRPGAQVTFQRARWLLSQQLHLVPQSLADQAFGAPGFRQRKRILVPS